MFLLLLLVTIKNKNQVTLFYNYIEMLVFFFYDVKFEILLVIRFDGPHKSWIDYLCCQNWINNFFLFSLFCCQSEFCFHLIQNRNSYQTPFFLLISKSRSKNKICKQKQFLNGTLSILENKPCTFKESLLVCTTCYSHP